MCSADRLVQTQPRALTSSSGSPEKTVPRETIPKTSEYLQNKSLIHGFGNWALLLMPAQSSK